MSEYVGVIDDIGNGLANMYVTDEPIVRCRDCESCDKDRWECKRTYVDCGVHIGETVYLHPDVDPDDFCSKGKRS